MNILFTNFCNKNCPYCFAKNKLAFNKKAPPSYLDLKDLKVIINFMKKSNQTMVGIIGGEPTLHPDFKEAFRMLIKAGFFVRIFSNGIINKHTLSFLNEIRQNSWEMTLNINSPETYTPKETYALIKTMKTIKNKIQLGITIYNLNFNADFLIDFIKKYNLDKVIRLGIANPLFGQNNRYINIKDHSKITPKLIKFAKKCDKEDILLKFDCGFTLCSFTEKEIGQLFYYNASFTASICRPVIDIGTDLSVWGCFITSNLWNKKLAEFINLDEIYKFYINKFTAIRMIGTTKKCLQCKYFKRMQCGGGCLGHTLKSFNISHTN